METGHYARRHANRINLLIHVFAVPLFIGYAILLVYSVVTGIWQLTSISFVAIGVSMGLQGLGHIREAVPPEPFAGPGDFVRRIIVEQFYLFPLFLVSGDWWKNLRQS